MPYELNWLDEDRRILSLRLLDMLDNQEVNALRDALVPILEQPTPLYFQLDLRDFKLLEGFSQLGQAMDGEALPDFDAAHLRHSRLAVLGGGPAIKLIFQLVGHSNEVGEAVRAFDYEDRAYSWLIECADAAKGH
jgi:hypothetical protein